MSVDWGTLKRSEAAGPGSFPPTLRSSFAPNPLTITMSNTVRLFLLTNRHSHNYGVLTTSIETHSNTEKTTTTTTRKAAVNGVMQLLAQKSLSDQPAFCDRTLIQNILCVIVKVKKSKFCQNVASCHYIIHTKFLL